MSSHRWWVRVACSPATTSVSVDSRQLWVGPDETRRSTSASHSSRLMPSGMAIELDTRKPLPSGAESTSSPGTSAPGLNCAKSVQVPPYSVTFHPAGTSKWYECRSDTNWLADREDGTSVASAVPARSSEAHDASDITSAVRSAARRRRGCAMVAKAVSPARHLLTSPWLLRTDPTDHSSREVPSRGVKPGCSHRPARCIDR